MRPTDPTIHPSPDIPALLAELVTHRVDFVLVGSAAVQAWGVDVGMPRDIDIVPALSRENLTRLPALLRELDAVATDPVSGRWTRTDTDPNLDDLKLFGSLFTTNHGDLHMVVRTLGTYADLITRAHRLRVQGIDGVAVMSPEALLAGLIMHPTLPRRAKDAGRVAALRDVQRRRLLASKLVMPRLSSETRLLPPA